MCNCLKKVKEYKWKAVRCFIWGAMQLAFGMILMHAGDSWSKETIGPRIFGFMVACGTLLNFNTFFGWLDKMHVTHKRHSINMMERGLF